MKLSGKQKTAIEVLTGRPWNSWHPQSLAAYFAKTDRGRDISVNPEAQYDFDELMSCHHWHSVIVEMWRNDFQKGLLFLSDFNDEPLPRQKHALEIYRQVFPYYKEKSCEEPRNGGLD